MTNAAVSVTDPMTLISFIVTVLVAAFGVWWKIQVTRNEDRREIDQKIHSAAAQSMLVAQQLAEHKTHVAESYVSKLGFRETMETVSQTLQTININLTHLNERIDRVIDNQNGARSREPKN
jgi:ABC-type nickel/cobalt efflux system permease component RcnA